MTVAVSIPEGLAEMPAGPGLSAALAGIDRTRIANNELLVALCAQSRQSAHEAALQLGLIAEVVRANPTFADDAVDRLPHPFLHAADEVRAALAWSRRAADRECDLAEQVVHDLPLVFAAFLAGAIDRPKVYVFAEHLTGLSAAPIERICEILVPIAGRLTPGQIAHRLRRLIAAIDPRHYERRYRKALRDRTVTAWINDQGAAVLSARGLTPTQAAAALDRIDLLAHAARRAGHRSTLDQIRVDIVAGLLDATLHHLDRDQIITHLIAHRSANDDPPADPATPTPPQTATETDTESDTDADADADNRSGADQDGHPDQADSPDSPDEADQDEADQDEAGQDEAGEDEGPDGAGAGGPAQQAASAAVGDQRVGIEIRVALSTLLGHDEHPGEIPGLGPVPASEARDTATAQRRAQWRFAITGPDGRLIFDGITRRRPTGLPTTGPPGGIVELHLPADLLEHLTTGNPTNPDTPDTADTAGTDGGGGDGDDGDIASVTAWTTVLADIARQFTDRDKRDLDNHPHDRLPRAGLRRHTQIRDRTCIGPGCRQRPQRCDQDHTIEHQHGGQTVAADLAPLCRHDHTLKNDAGWDLEQSQPGTFTWTSPLGGRYDVQPEPILPPLPEPCPSQDGPAHDQPAHAGDERLILWKPDPPPPPPATPPVGDPDEPPPF